MENQKKHTIKSKKRARKGAKPAIKAANRNIDSINTDIGFGAAIGRLDI